MLRFRVIAKFECHQPFQNSTQQNLSMECWYSTQQLALHQNASCKSEKRVATQHLTFSAQPLILWTLNFWYPFQQRSHSIISHFLHQCKLVQCLHRGISTCGAFIIGFRCSVSVSMTSFPGSPSRPNWTQRNYSKRSHWTSSTTRTRTLSLHAAHRRKMSPALGIP